MRLIDADKLRKQIHCEYSDDLGILEKIDEQPTAYDVDEVIKRLEKLRDCKYSVGITNDAYEFGACHALNDTIKIIKAGSKDE